MLDTTLTGSSACSLSALVLYDSKILENESALGLFKLSFAVTDKLLFS